MPAMRAKLSLTSVEPYPADGEPSQETLRFIAVTAKPFDPDGLNEDNTFSRYTPSAELRMVITNPALLDKFRAGQVFYVDFTEVTES